MASTEQLGKEALMDKPIRRDPEDRPAAADDVAAQREKNFDKTLADSFPTSDPPSTIPDPSEPED